MVTHGSGLIKSQSIQIAKSGVMRATCQVRSSWSQVKLICRALLTMISVTSGWTPMTNITTSLDVMGVYTKCIRVGSGWNILNKKASFYVPKAYDASSRTGKQAQADSLGVEVTIYSTDKAVFLPNGTLPSWMPKTCWSTAGNLTNPNICNWDRLFSEPAPLAVANRTTNVNTVEMMIGDGTNASMVSPSTSKARS